MRGVCVCVAPLETPGRPTNHHAPCCMSMPSSSSQCTRGAGGDSQACPLQVRASSLCRAHLLEPFKLSTTRYPLPCLGVGDGQRRCDAKRGLLGEDERDEAAGSDESFAACRLPTASRTPGRSEILLYLRRATDLMISACVPLDLPRLMAFPHFPTSRPGRALAGLAVGQMPC